MELSTTNISNLVSAKIAETHTISESASELTLTPVSLQYTTVDAANIENTIAENIAVNITSNAIGESVAYAFNIGSYSIDETDGVYTVIVNFNFGVN